MFISQAFADSASSQSGGFISFLPMIFFIVILYFLLIKPQQKKQKQHQMLIASVKKGDKVLTSSGIIANVSKVLNDQEIIIEIATGVHCKFVKSSIVSVFNTGGVEQNQIETKSKIENSPKEETPKKTTPVIQKNSKAKVVKKKIENNNSKD